LLDGDELHISDPDYLQDGNFLIRKGGDFYQIKSDKIHILTHAAYVNYKAKYVREAIQKWSLLKIVKLWWRSRRGKDSIEDYELE
jgi:hypothetical protein